MITGDIISAQSFNSYSSMSLLFPYENENVLKIIDEILILPETQEEKALKELMLSNINWEFLVQQYKNHKIENEGLYSMIKKFQSLNIQTTSRKKRQIEMIEETPSLNLSMIESMVENIQKMNVSQYQSILMNLTTAFKEIRDELVTISVQLNSEELDDISSLVTMTITSPQIAIIAKNLVNIMNQIEPMFENSEYINIFLEVKKGIQELNKFFYNSSANLKLVNIINNWETISKSLIDGKILNSDEANSFGNAIVSSQAVFSLFSLIDKFQCSKEEITRYINFYDNHALLNTTEEKLINGTCGFIQSKYMISLLEVIDWFSALDFWISVVQLTPNTLAIETNLTNDEFMSSIDSVSKAVEISSEVLESIEALWEKLNVTEFDMTSMFRLTCGAEFSLLDIDYEVKFL